MTITATSADGTPIRATDQGQGPPILIVHPGSSDASSWAEVAARLAYRFRVVRIHRRLYAADRPPPGHSMATEVDDVLAIAKVLDGPLVLVGHSSGAVVALESALTAPALFAGMLLYEPPVAVDRPLGGAALRRARAALDAGRPGRAMAIHLREIVEAPRLSGWRKLRPYAAAQISDDEAMEALGVGLDRYAGLDVPTCLLRGERSPANLRRRSEALAAVLPRLLPGQVLRQQGHAAHLTAPIEVAWAIEDLADAVSRRIG
ncbi:alpha/beta fold hydrolase [Paractinoplanes rishiriensis]|uniref:alpha/beta fold hydrolase n=1 Tax=Paractinoplanes rishiriensis TaxID=1050105 RepID=UPI00194268E0|nr:alpha/beta hydrolase [Actinoplanes rishiriensis]